MLPLNAVFKILLLINWSCLTQLPPSSINYFNRTDNYIEHECTKKRNIPHKLFFQLDITNNTNISSAIDKCRFTNYNPTPKDIGNEFTIASHYDRSNNTNIITSSDRLLQKSSEYEDVPIVDLSGFIDRSNNIISTSPWESFFVITAIFNPAFYKSRYNLYNKFVKHMNETGAQLITVECIFPSLNQTKFQVTDSKNPWHIQLKSESIYWMKENLINIAVSRLPPHAKWICWLDSDLEFEEKNWVELTINELKYYTAVQMFKKAKFLGPLPENKVLNTDYSFGYSVVHDKPVDPEFFEEWYPHPGYGWAMSLKDFLAINGLPDYDIVGSGDLFFAYTLINKLAFVVEYELFPQFTKLILNKSNANFAKLQNISLRNSKEVVGYVPTIIRHNWHGSLKYRQYVERLSILKDNNYDFFKDIDKTHDGLFQLNSNKPDLQAGLLTYFQTRHEDAMAIEF